MVRVIFFDNEITLWWELSDAPQATAFYAELNGKRVLETTKTHVSFGNLCANTAYRVTVKTNGNQILFDETITTRKEKKRIDITQAPYFAVGDGKSLNTAVIQRALDDCTSEDCVYFPQGIFLSGALKLHSNTELYFDEGAVLQGTENVEDYSPKIKSRFEGLDMLCYSSLLNMGDCDGYASYNCHNIVIRGKGKIVGGGVPLRNNVVNLERERLKSFMESLGDKIKEYETLDTIPGRARPRLINVSNTEGFVITGVGIENGPAWNLHLLYSKDITVYGCTFRSQPHINGDGCDPDSCDNCAIFDCDFYVGDDCIAIKSGKNPDGNKVNRPCKNIYVFDCRPYSGHGISIGSEMSGGVENVYIWDCDMSGCIFGSQIKATKKRGGYVKNIHVSKCVLPIVMIWSVPYNDDGESANAIPVLSDYYYKDCTIVGKKVITPENEFCKHILLRGFDEDNPVKNVYFQGLTLKDDSAEQLSCISEMVENVVFS